MDEKRNLHMKTVALELVPDDGARRGEPPVACKGRRRSLLWNLAILFAGNWLLYSGMRRLFNPGDLSKHVQSISPSAPQFLECFQVYEPPPYGRSGAGDGIKNDGSDTCTQTLMEHVFAFSYGQPFVGDYNPPECEWTHVTFNLSFVSAGVQFDRLALLFLDDVEIWRTSTAEPTHAGIHWEHIKDMTMYRSLLKDRGKLIMDLGNLVNDVYTGSFNGTLTATYHNIPSSGGNNATASDGVSLRNVIVGAGGDSAADPPDLIYPISAMRSGDSQGSEFRIPRDNASAEIALKEGSFSRATISISASGDSGEEFWYTNVPSSLAGTFDGDPLPKYSPFREVQVWLDGEMVGVAWPFPVIFTGGVSPGLWRPIVGMTAFDLVEYEVDVTPWLWRICDGENHSWELRVVGLDEDEGKLSIGSTVGWDWIVTGRLLLWNSPPESGRTKGSLISHTPDWNPAISLSYSWTTVGSKNDSLSVKMSVMRTVSTVSTLEFDDYSTTASFSQSLSFSTEMFISAGGANQTITQSTDITMASSTTGTQVSYHFPATVRNDFIFYDKGAFSIIAAVDRGLNVAASRLEDVHHGPIKRGPSASQQVVGSAAAASPPKTFVLSNRQNGTSTYFSRGGPGRTTGHTEQVYRLKRYGEETYFNHVEAEGSQIIRDEERSAIGGYSGEKAAGRVSHRVPGAGAPANQDENVCLGRFERSKLSRLLP